MKAVVSAIIGNALITIVKLIGWMATSSPSMAAEAVHSLADTCNQILLFVGIKQGSRGPTREFPMGRGRARYVWNLISAIGIFFIGFGVTFYHGFLTLLYPHTNPRVGLIGIGVLLFSLVVEGYVFFVALKSVREEKGEASFIQYLRESDDPTIIGVLFEDGIAVLGILLALAGIYLTNYANSPLPDSVASIMISFLLGLMAVGLAYINGRLLVGVAAPKADEEEIRRFVEEQPLVEKVISLQTTVLGPDQLRLSIEIEFHGGYLIDREAIGRDAESIRNGEEDPMPILVDTVERTVRIIGNEINSMEKKLRQKFPSLTIIELEVN